MKADVAQLLNMDIVRARSEESGENSQENEEIA